jgi:peptide chain release factor 2
MLKQRIPEIQALQQKLASTWELLDLDKTHAAIEADEWETQQPDFWKEREHAERVSRRLTDLRAQYADWKSLRDGLHELLELAQMALAEGDESMDAEVGAKFDEYGKTFAKLEFAVLLGERYDDRDAILAIHAGAGGTDAQDWAEMLLRMYFRYCERKGWKAKLLDESRGGEAGIKSATFAVEGRYAYGHLKAEAGVHRLVRLSPFNSDQLRQTSFALLEVLPDLGDIEEVKIDSKDLRIDTFLAGGHGGQGVQTTYSAVRVTHIPTGFVVSCQNERSQTQNKETALRILRAKLHARYLAERQAEKLKLRGEFHSAEWGSQIRSYVIHPYQMVKDHRTKHETADTQGVLDGDLDAFVEAYLRQNTK